MRIWFTKNNSKDITPENETDQRNISAKLPTRSLSLNAFNARSKVFSQTVKSMKARRSYNYTTLDYLYNLWWCLKSKKFCNNKPMSLYNRYQLFKKGSKLFINELDIVNYARSLRKLKMLVHSLMDDHEKFLSFYQHSNTIDLDWTDSDSDFEIQKIPKMFSKYTLENDEYQKRIDKFIQSYSTTPITAKDYRLMNGVYNKKFLNDKELEIMEINLEDAEKGNNISTKTKGSTQKWMTQEKDLKGIHYSLSHNTKALI